LLLLDRQTHRNKEIEDEKDLAIRPNSMVLLALLLLLLSSLWLGIHVHVDAQTYCSVPPTFADTGATDTARWQSFQRVTVTFYQGDFTADERAAIKSVFDEFELAGRIQNCSQVDFTGFAESIFPKPWGNSPNTYYVHRGGLLNTNPGGRQVCGSFFGTYFKITNCYTKLRSDVTLTSFSIPLKSTMRHEIGHTFYLADS
jgi:hypothetical protein